MLRAGLARVVDEQLQAIKNRFQIDVQRRQIWLLGLGVCGELGVDGFPVVDPGVGGDEVDMSGVVVGGFEEGGLGGEGGDVGADEGW